MPNKIKILFLTQNLGGGGAERVLVNLANHLNKDRFDVTVETMFEGGVNRTSLDADVSFFCKNAPCFPGISKIAKFIPATFLYKYFIGEAEYDIVVAFMHGLPAKVVSGCHDGSSKIVAWLHNGNPEKGSFFIPWIKEKQAFTAYDRFDAIVGVSKDVTKAFSSYTGIVGKNITLLNVNDINRIISESTEAVDVSLPEEGITVCSVGKLQHIKGFDRLLDAVARLNSEGHRCNVLIIGAGDSEELNRRSYELGLGDRVQFTGFQKNPYALMRMCDLFVLSSRSEGLPTVLTEALALGLPVISTNVSGAKEVLGYRDEFGLVVENSTEGIYQGMKKMLEDPVLCDEYRTRSQGRAMQFGVDHTVPAVEKFFEGLTS